MQTTISEQRHVTPIIELTEDCNLGCKYCYTGSAFLPIGKTKRINEKFAQSIPLLLRSFREVVDYNGGRSTLIIFHGGEPLLIEPSNWKILLSEARKLDLPSLRFSLQTNGTLINDEYCEIFKEYDLQVGVSLDGPSSVNDVTRPNKGGGSSFSAVWLGIERLRAHEIKFGVLVTLTAANVNQVREIYEFFVSEGIQFSMRPIFGSTYTDTKDFRLSAEAYAGAFCELFDLWFDDPNVDFSMISEFSTMMAQFAEPIEGWVSCSFTKACSEHFISYDLDGKMSPCNRFHGNEEFTYGNLNEASLETILNGPLPTKLGTRWEVLDKEECGSCDMKQFCYGGCPANNVSSGESYFARDFYCGAYKSIHAHVVGRMRSTLLP
ncbi:MAG: radical SAM protein [Caulobacter sp.]|nr:radical SAM protein [Caulobacter sp.]